jgi:4-amino-4-deoxy-L-arabinose transferase-like glycosyltransferase
LTQATVPTLLPTPRVCAASDRSGRGWQTPALILVLVLAGLIRFQGLDREGRWGDEYCQTMQYGGSPLTVILGARTTNQPPLDYLIGWAVTRIAPTTWMMRAPAACFGVAGIVMLYLLTRRLSDASTAVLAAMLLALAPLHWKLSQEARPYTIFVFALLLTLWLFARAWEKPSAARIAGYLVAGGWMLLTRGLAPHVVTLSIGMVLTCTWLRARAGSAERLAARRLWGATVLLGLAGGGVLWFLLQGDAGWTTFTADGAPTGGSLARRWTALVRNAGVWSRAPGVLFGYGAELLLLLGLIGLVQAVRTRQQTPAVMRVIGPVGLLVGPLYLLIFSIAVTETPIRVRYALFLTPIICVLASIALVAMLRSAVSSPRRTLRLTAGAIVLGAAVGLPGLSTWALAGQFDRPDWRGSAGYLEDAYDADDVVLVFADRPLGAGQPPYWGKLDWTDLTRRPLGESLWTCAVSESHWQRLIAQTGTCCLVVKHPVYRQTAGAYLHQGLTPAHLSPGEARLRKFRGLDVVEGFAGGNLLEQVATLCDAVLTLPLRHAESRAIPLTLRSRIEWHLDRQAAARRSYFTARDAVPPARREWFDRLTATHRAAMNAE